MQKKIVHQLDVSTFLKVGLYLSYFRKPNTFIPVFEVAKVSGRHRGHFGRREERNK